MPLNVSQFQELNRDLAFVEFKLAILKVYASELK
jgi:hypothetical protein